MIRVGKCRFGLFFQLEGLPRWFAQAVYYGGFSGVLPGRFAQTWHATSLHSSAPSPEVCRNVSLPDNVGTWRATSDC